MEILILGWFGHHNIGDEQYKSSFVKLFPQHHLTFTDVIKASHLEKCEAIILGGGNVIRTGFLDQLKKINKKIDIYAMSAGIEEPQDLRIFKKVYGRDRQTLELAAQQGVPHEWMPDIALTMTPNKQNGLDWIKQGFANETQDLYSKVVTVIVNGYMVNGQLGQLARDAFSFLKFSYDFARVLDETSASFIFLPFGTQIPYDDRVANTWVAAKCKYWKKNLLVYDRLSPQTTLDIIAASDAVISSRLHSSIFSFVGGTPFVDITHHSKNALFLEMINQQQNSVNFWNFQPEELKSKLQLAIETSHHNLAAPFADQIRNIANGIHFN